ncbi:mannitol-1-phosphate 5-dehydrogenase [Alkalibacter rhizosphaerae]|uniref:Mannitol-1-phosphate 5-dehydrogenase n=1 Tax=Alkalibacter rhizosphaerae TaxID=2815577 RepID=A0A975AH17_9FIRM|nr:mannitol-1-phosphate 5-dehydrogenase [Alkalibacter rhizosphaerae]QSX07538.1 mannitol-1-phosphate 5-dehydrogenase [Alkalibacter rhizosphaerae]
MKNAVHFGAGNIGRGFIGLLLAQAGYQVTFVDVNETVLQELNEKGSYPVHIAGGDEEVIWVRQVRGLNSRNQEALDQAIAEAEVVTTAVGVNVLPIIGKSMAASLERIARKDPSKTLNIMACENAVGNGDILKNSVYEHLSLEGQKFCDENVGFPNTTVDRIVPENTDKSELLSVLVEPFYEWNVERSKLVGSLDEIPGMNLVDNLSAYIERKLFTLNTGHAIAAYLGYQNQQPTILDAVADPEIKEVVLGAMGETGQALVKKHGFDPDQHEAYIQKIMGRFENAALIDPVERVGRDPLRKLGPKDRLIAPARTALEYGVEPENLVKGIVAALKFDHPQDPAAVSLSTKLKENGLDGVLVDVCGLDPSEALYDRIKNAYA